MKAHIQYNPGWKPPEGELAGLPALVDKAITALGYIRPEASAWFAEKLEEHFYGGNVGYQIRKSGDLIPQDHLADLGYSPSLRLSYEAHVALSEKGRADPVAAFEKTALHAIRSHARKGKRERAARVAKVFPWVRVMTVPNRCCEAAEQLKGLAIPISKSPDFPLPGCDKEDCACSLGSLMDSDLKRYNLRTE